MRLIDADAIKLPKGFFEKVDNVPKFYEWLNEQPTVEERKTGKWIRHGMASIKGYTDYFNCSECGTMFWADNFHYCPNCGAKMDKEDEK